jgi:hypothetical protein
MSHTAYFSKSALKSAASPFLGTPATILTIACLNFL